MAFIWTEEEATTFFRAIDGHRHEIIFVLAIHCGMRMGEIHALRFSDIDLKRGDYICEAYHGL
ncbi:tyrosine-type recombinase/integrase [Paenibacillus sp. LMG 31458]|uniref:Tyrosine-type recombinase/integrase n=1 Tax=Paenibacillus phytorum TaxID=2654977 RepID=A0ABX1XS04_9BACL|nr:tyrosine-type recombinase/integrase [Paenibacillus phytorum]